MLATLIANTSRLLAQAANGPMSHSMIDSLIANTSYPYAIVALILLASGFGAPIPEDIPLILGGYLCYEGIGDANIYVMLPVTFGAVIGADLIIFYLGRRYGQHIPRIPVIRRFLTPDRLAKATESFHKHGGKTIFIGRFLPGLRAPIFFTAGSFGIPAWKFLLSDGVAALISVPVLVLAGFFFGEYIHKVRVIAGRAEIAIVVVIVIAIAGVFWYRRRRPRLAEPS
ncbi:MAG: DedA family protein [Planctomycetes bacterium]|nr:DedA family protein [Planctomycetota bacterium]